MTFRHDQNKILGILHQRLGLFTIHHNCHGVKVQLHFFTKCYAFLFQTRGSLENLDDLDSYMSTQTMPTQSPHSIP